MVKVSKGHRDKQTDILEENGKTTTTKKDATTFGSK